MKNYLLGITIALLGLISCSRGYEAIDYGNDGCAHCKMTIVDKRFAAEFLTTKGKPYKFDDVHCMVLFLAEHKNITAAQVYVQDYLDMKGIPLNASKAVFLQHESFKSPMGGNYAAFETETEASELSKSLNVKPVDWEIIKK